MRDPGLKQYADAVMLWRARFDTKTIADELCIHESIVARWVANFREVTRQAEQRVDRQIQSGAYHA